MTTEKNMKIKRKKPEVLEADSPPKKAKFSKKSSSENETTSKQPRLMKNDKNKFGKKKPLPKETAKSRKERKVFRKQQNPTFELSNKAKQIWEKLRIQKNRLTPTEKSELVEELMKLVTEHDKQLIGLAYAHDTSRVLQTCLKQGSKEQREKIFQQLNDHIVDMCKNGYAKNIVWKMLKYGTPEERSLVMKSFKDKAYKLLRNAKSSGVVEYAYNNYATAQQRNIIVSQLYGKIFQMCKQSDDDTFSSVVAREPDKKESLLQSFKEALSPLVEKSVVVHTLVHKAFYDFFQNCDDQTIRGELIEVVRESLVHMIHTHDGAHVTMNCLWHGSNKDRKVIIKSLKDFVVKLSCEEFGHLPLLAALDCIDDTVFLKKALITPITKNLDEVIHNKYGRKVSLYLMKPRNTSHFLPEVITLLQRGDENKTSKKTMSVRHNEVSQAASPSIIEYVTSNLRPLVFDRSLFVIVETAILCCLGDRTPLIEALLSIASEPFKPGSKDKDGKLHLIEDPSGHLLVKRIVVSESKAKETDQNAESIFSNLLLQTLKGNSLAQWASCNRGCQILLALVESRDDSVSTRSKKALKAHLSSLQEHSSEIKSAQILCSKLE